MENLIYALTAVLRHIPDNPMTPEWIGIQSRGMKQWVAAQIAQNLGICANTQFLFPRQMIDQILANFTPLQNQSENPNKTQSKGQSEKDVQKQNQKENLNQDTLIWSIMQLISENQAKNELAQINDYIKDDKTGKKLYQLSMKVAKVFDDYLIYRPSMLMIWQKQNSYKNLETLDEKWQAWLWRAITVNDFQNNIAYQTTHFLEHFDMRNKNLDHLPSRISFFGISSIPAIFLQVFEKISQVIDINLFLLTPSNQFFFDIKSEKQIGNIALNSELTNNLTSGLTSGLTTGLASESLAMDSDQLYYEVANSLLSSLGTAGKNFQSSLESFNYNEPVEDLFSDPLSKSSSMLSYLQSDIFNLVHRKNSKENPLVNIEHSDTSISVHACHSPMRETQVLKNLLLNEFEKDSTLAPHDIIVMMPNIEAYAPFIESVFSLEHKLPFSISDRRQRSESEPFEAFFKILTLKNSRFGRHQVLDLLLSDSIAKKFNIRVDEIVMIEKMVEDSSILWGKNDEHRKSLELPPFKENTWEFGLQRLFMGMAMPENHDALVQGILPCDTFEGLDLEVLGKFTHFLDTLFSAIKTLDGEKSIDQWCLFLKSICTSLMVRNRQNSEDLTFLMHTIDKLNKDAKKANFDKEISFDVIFSIIEQKLDQNISFGKFLTGNITFCNTMPMRSIPFKIVVLMGMDEKSFPKQVFVPGFDLIKKHPEPLDKNERDEERYLFLETLLSTRSKFIVTYTGLSIQDNSMLPCAGVVNELCDTIDHSFVFPENYSYCFSHPLHPFDEKYFLIDEKDSLKNSNINTKSSFFSFSKDNCNIAKALNNDNLEKHQFLDVSQIKEKSNLKEKSTLKKTDNLKKTSSNITLSDMSHYFKNPIQWFMKQGLEITISNLEELSIDRESFTISGLDQYSIGNLLVEQNIKSTKLNLPQKAYYPILKAMGDLPLGKKGKLEYENIKTRANPIIEAAKIISTKKQLEVYSGEINIDSLRISDNLSDIYEDGAYNFYYGNLNGSRLLLAWIKHLFLNITAPENYPKNTIIIGQDPAKKKDLLEYHFPSLESKGLESTGLEYFKDLVQIFQKGGRKAFYFASETSWQLVQILLKNNFKPDSSFKLDSDFKPDSNSKSDSSFKSDQNIKLDQDIIFKAMNSNKVKNAWSGGYNQTGEKDNRYISLCLENKDPFENVETLIDSGFVQNSIRIFGPMLANLVEVKTKNS